MPRFDISLVPGARRDLPAHLLHQEGGISYARVLNNLRPDRGELARRPGMVAAGTPPTLNGMAGPWPVVLIEEINIAPGLASRFLIATSRELFLGDPVNGWSNVTPVYTTGTVTVTNGSPTVTGAGGTSWETRGIYGSVATGFGNWFQGPDNAWHQIRSVDSDTQITLLTNYAGGTTAGAAYTIRRTHFTDASQGLNLFIARQNQDLYVAGEVSGGESGTSGTNVADGGVLKIPLAYDLWQAASGFSGSNTVFVTSGRADPSGTTDNLGYNFQVMGFGAIADGRLAMAIQHHDRSAGTSGGSRVAYSSPASTAVWTTSPGGATDIADLSGAITAATFTAYNVSVHFENGIEVGELTGQDDPPFRFRVAQFGVGAISPRMVALAPAASTLGGREVFVGSDLNLYSFNGVSAQPLPASSLKYELSDEGNEATGIEDRGLRSEGYGAVQGGFLMIDPYRSEVAVFVRTDAGGGNFQPMREVRWNYETGDSWRGHYPGSIYCGKVLSTMDPAGGERWASSINKSRIVLGTTTGTSWWWRLDEAASSDTYDAGEATFGIFALFEGIDVGRPETTKVLEELLVYVKAPFQATPAATTLKARWFSDDFPSGETKTATVTPARVQLGDAQDFVRPEYVAIFRDFTETKWRSLALLVGSNDDDAFAATITRITGFYEETGDVRAE